MALGTITPNLYPLSPDELVCFGWSDPPVSSAIFSVRGPDGKRVIPTRQRTASGEFFYGEVATTEPPPGVADEVWDSHFNQETNEPHYLLA